MWLEAMGVPYALDGAKRDADGLSHGAAGPMGGLARRFRAGERQHFGDDAGRKRSPAGLARFVAQETIDSFLAVSLLPAPNSRAADAGAARDFQDRRALGGKDNDLRPLDMLKRPVSITNDAEQTFAIFGRDYDIDSLRHVARFAYPARHVNPMSASVH